MMIRAYPEIYLSKMQAVLGETFEYAVNSCHLSGQDFVKLFTASSVSKRIENGEPGYLAGKSGIEAAIEILNETIGITAEYKPSEYFTRSKEYWIGWAIAYYQWYSGKKYSIIFQALPYEILEELYITLHEADISKFTDIAAQRLKTVFPETHLKHIRTLYGCTQAELAKQSGVGLRSIQMYEQRKKDINKASAETIFQLSKVLGCSMEDLIET